MLLKGLGAVHSSGTRDARGGHPELFAVVASRTFMAHVITGAVSAWLRAVTSAVVSKAVPRLPALPRGALEAERGMKKR